MVIARVVVERRRELGMGQEELAERLGTSQMQIWRIESGEANPTVKTLEKLEEALGLSFKPHKVGSSWDTPTELAGSRPS